MYICINGQLGSGKSVICDFLKKEKNFEIFSTGKIQRSLASRRGLSTLELNETAMNDSSFDDFIDNALVEFAEENEGKNVVFDSRMAWHFVPNSFKIHLLINPSIAAQRVFSNRRTTEEAYETEKDTLDALVERRRLEKERYKSLYNVNMNDLKNYDLVLDTSSLSIEEMCEIVYREYEKFASGIKKHTLFISPKNVYPTQGIRNISMSRVRDYKEQNEKIDNTSISVAQIEDSLFIIDGHHRIIAANLLGKNYLKANLLYSDGDVFPGGLNSTKFVSNMTISDIYDWEDINKIVFNYYPSCIRSGR